MYIPEPFSTGPSTLQIPRRHRLPVPAILCALAAAGLTVLVLVVAVGIGSNSSSLPQRRDTPPPSAKVATTIVQPGAQRMANVRVERFVRLGR